MSLELWRYQLKYVTAILSGSVFRQTTQRQRCTCVSSGSRRVRRSRMSRRFCWLAALSYQSLPRELGWAQWGTPRTPRARFKPFPSLEQVANAAVTLHESPACLADMLYTVSMLAVKVSPCVNAERLDLLQLYTVQTYYCLMVWVHGSFSRRRSYGVFTAVGRSPAGLCWDRVYVRLHLLAHAQLSDWTEQSIVKLPVVC